MKWSLDDIAFLRRNYGTWPDERLADRLGVTLEAVSSKAAELALGKDKRRFGVDRMPRWRDEEIEELRREYPNANNVDLARRLGRSVKSIVGKAHGLGLKKTHDRLRSMGSENVRLRRDRIEQTKEQGGE